MFKVSDNVFQKGYPSFHSILGLAVSLPTLLPFFKVTVTSQVKKFALGKCLPPITK